MLLRRLTGRHRSSLTWTGWLEVGWGLLSVLGFMGSGGFWSGWKNASLLLVTQLDQRLSSSLLRASFELLVLSVVRDQRWWWWWWLLSRVRAAVGRSWAGSGRQTRGDQEQQKRRTSPVCQCCGPEGGPLQGAGNSISSSGLGWRLCDVSPGERGLCSSQRHILGP